MAHEYLWHPAYVAAILETDESCIAARVYEALAAIEQRHLVPLDEDEERALRNARLGLAVLKGERIEAQFEQKMERSEANTLPRSRGSYARRASR